MTVINMEKIEYMQMGGKEEKIIDLQKEIFLA